MVFTFLCGKHYCVSVDTYALKGMIYLNTCSYYNLSNEKCIKLLFKSYKYVCGPVDDDLKTLEKSIENIFK